MSSHLTEENIQISMEEYALVPKTVKFIKTTLSFEWEKKYPMKIDWYYYTLYILCYKDLAEICL